MIAAVWGRRPLVYAVPGLAPARVQFPAGAGPKPRTIFPYAMQSQGRRFALAYCVPNHHPTCVCLTPPPWVDPVSPKILNMFF
jgi:hypothetical protein